MKFTDEESREQFHSAPTLLQLVCQMFENEAFLFHVEPELIEVQGDVAVLGLPDLSEDVCNEIELKINQQFLRKDSELTCTLVDPEIGLFAIQVTQASDFQNVH